jgi:signal transduction histidine kinase
MWKKLLAVSLIFIVSVVILITLSLYSFQRFNAYVQYSNAVDHHHVLRSELSQLRLILVDLENNQRAFLLFSDSTFLEKYTNHEQSIRETFASIHKLIKDDPDQRKRLRSLNLLIKSRLDDLRTGLAVGYTSTGYEQGKRYMEKCVSVMADMEAAENETLNAQMQTKEFYQQTTPQNFSVVFILTMTIFAISFGLLLQQYRDRLIYQQKLESNIVELNQANSEWEQIAYAASHDLQEPLRKLRTFSGILLSRHATNLNEEGLNIVKRIDAASGRAQSLMQDIVNYNSIVYPREELSPVDFGEVCKELMTDLEEILKQKNALIFADYLPVIRAYPSQISLLLLCLIDNSLKFSKPGETVKIRMTASIIPQKELPLNQNLSFTHYHKIIFEDNGIGFENQFSEKIFKMFQRLHNQNSQYEGRGIGLAIVKRIMTNHLGLVVARGRPDKGAKFTLYFPVR